MSGRDGITEAMLGIGESDYRGALEVGRSENLETISE